MVVYNSEPKLYMWTINGTEVPFTTEELLTLRTIRIKILEFTGIVLGKDDMDDKKMTELLKIAMSNKKVSEVEWSMTPKGMLFSNLVSYLAQHQLDKYSSDEELWQAISKGQTYHDKDKGKWYLKMDSFNKHQIAMEQRTYKPAEMMRILKSHVDAQSKVKRLPRSSFVFRYWEMDADKVEFYGVKKCNEGEDYYE